MPSDEFRDEATVLERRRVLQLSAASLVALAGGAERLWAAVASGAAPAYPLPTALKHFLEAFCDALIPANDTGGALAGNAPAFVELVWSHAMSGAEMAETTAGLAAIDAELDRRGGAAFAGLPLARRIDVLQPFDREIMAAPPGAKLPTYAAVYRQLKATVVFGYYTSEIGASKELRYELVPGRYDPDVPVDPNQRPFSNGS